MAKLLRTTLLLRQTESFLSVFFRRSFNFSRFLLIQFCEKKKTANQRKARSYTARLSERIEMETRKLGNSDLKITPVGFGAWAIGGSGWEFAWGPQDDKDSIAAIHRALELGVNWIDTAAVYGLGHSEEVVARALKEWRGPRPYGPPPQCDRSARSRHRRAAATRAEKCSPGDRTSARRRGESRLQCNFAIRPGARSR